MTLLGKPNLDWMGIKKEIADPNFINKMKNYDKDNVSKSVLKQAMAYTNMPEFNHDSVKKKSAAAGSVC